jgi:hypothetical protein
VPVSLVTIGIPAYNRPGGLERTLRSVLAQDHPEIEVLVSDDASPDAAVQEVALRFASADPRVRVVRQAQNLGHAGNYQFVLEAASGEYFMWLADDDWIDPQYVGHCLAVLRADPTAVLVCGLASYYRDGVHVLDERPIELDCERPAARVIRYFARVSLNGPLFGVARRGDLLAIGFPQVVAGDWLLIAALAARGHVRTLRDVRIHRSLSGLGSDATQLARSFGMHGPAARQHHVVVAGRAWGDISFRDAAFSGIGRLKRVGVGTAAAVLILLRFTLADLVRAALGARVAASLERRISGSLRARDGR